MRVTNHVGCIDVVTEFISNDEFAAFAVGLFCIMISDDTSDLRVSTARWPNTIYVHQAVVTVHIVFLKCLLLSELEGENHFHQCGFKAREFVGSFMTTASGSTFNCGDVIRYILISGRCRIAVTPVY